MVPHKIADIAPNPEIMWQNTDTRTEKHTGFLFIKKMLS